LDAVEISQEICEEPRLEFLRDLFFFPFSRGGTLPEIGVSATRSTSASSDASYSGLLDNMIFGPKRSTKP